MTVKIRSSVRSTRTKSFGWAWVTAASDDETHLTKKMRFGYASTMAEALTEAHHAAETIGQELMDEVHESRLRRRVLVGIGMETRP